MIAYLPPRTRLFERRSVADLDQPAANRPAPHRCSKTSSLLLMPDFPEQPCAKAGTQGLPRASGGNRPTTSPLRGWSRVGSASRIGHQVLSVSAPSKSNRRAFEREQTPLCRDPPAPL